MMRLAVASCVVRGESVVHGVSGFRDTSAAAIAVPGGGREAQVGASLLQSVPGIARYSIQEEP
ncbi:hypothetical protein DKG71_00215 [Streptomyces sp. NEAU-S7GS2]|nr:hypothetical protein DKG71_00215 [Streptomyces sp. NEAU-S7GS2]